MTTLKDPDRKRYTMEFTSSVGYGHIARKDADTIEEALETVAYYAEEFELDAIIDPDNLPWDDVVYVDFDGTVFNLAYWGDGDVSINLIRREALAVPAKS